MISKQFLYYSTKEEFLTDSGYKTNPNQETNLDTYGEIYGSSIAYIADSKEIWTHGVFYKCDISASEVENLVNSGKISPATITPLIAGTAAIGTSTKYAREDHVHPVQTTISGNAGSATKLSSARTFKLTGAVTGSASSDLTSGVSVSTTLSNIDASKITTGTIDIARLPAGALERLFVCDTEALALSANVQEGDVVQVVNNNNKMYFCISNTATTFATKFKEFTAGTATSVPWSGITNKPTTFTPSVHNQASNTITTLTGYTKGSVAALTTSDTLNTALGKLEANINYYKDFIWADTTKRGIKAGETKTTGISTYFVEKEAISTTATSGNIYGDFLVLNTFGNNTGGTVNALYIPKNKSPYNPILYYAPSNSSDPWIERGTLAFASDLNEYLPLSGGTLTGDLTINCSLSTSRVSNVIYTWYDKDVAFGNIQETRNLYLYSATGSFYVKRNDWSHNEEIWHTGNLKNVSQLTNDSGYLTSVPAQTWASITGKPTFASVATSGDYNDLANRPTIPSLSGYATESWVTSKNYLTSIPAATNSVYGGIQIGYSTNGKNYAVQLSDGKAYVYVPWQQPITYQAGKNISISQDTISCTYSLTIATRTNLGGVRLGQNITVDDYGEISLVQSNIISALGYTPANIKSIPPIPIALPNPHALTINGTSYTGSSAISITTPKNLERATLTGSTVSAGYNYNNNVVRTISAISGFSENNPDTVIISTAKLTFTASNIIKMDGLDDLSGTYYIYCFSYMANGKVAVNGAIYA